MAQRNLYQKADRVRRIIYTIIFLSEQYNTVSDSFIMTVSDILSGILFIIFKGKCFGTDFVIITIKTKNYLKYQKEFTLVPITIRIVVIGMLLTNLTNGERMISIKLISLIWRKLYLVVFQIFQIVAFVI